MDRCKKTRQERDDDDLVVLVAYWFAFYENGRLKFILV
jgi:hypothetical protein